MLIKKTINQRTVNRNIIEIVNLSLLLQLTSYELLLKIRCAININYNIFMNLKKQANTQDMSKRQKELQVL